MAASPSSVAARASTAASGVPPGPPLFDSFRPSQRQPFPPVVSRPGSGLSIQQVPGSSSGKTAAPPSGLRLRPLAPPQSYADVVKPRVVKASQDLHLFGNPKKHPGVKRFARDGVPVVSIDNGVSSALAAPFKWTLVGKFSHGVPSFSQIRKFFDNLKLAGFFNIHRLSHTQFLIVLGEELDFVRVWLGKIWHVAGFPMRLFKWTPSFDTKFESALTPVWVRLPGLPAHLFDRGVLFEIASILGKPIRADLDTALRTKFSEARFCVEIDLQLPRVDHFLLDIGGESRRQRVVYENLPLFCSFCQRVGHFVDSCFKCHKGLKLGLGSTGEEAKEDGQLVCTSANPFKGPSDFLLELAYPRFLDMVDRFFGGVRGVPRPPADLFPFLWLRGSQVWVGVPGSGVGAGALCFLPSRPLIVSKSGECDFLSPAVEAVVGLGVVKPLQLLSACGVHAVSVPSCPADVSSSSGHGELAIVGCAAGLHGASSFPAAVHVEDGLNALLLVEDDARVINPAVVDGDLDAEVVVCDISSAGVVDVDVSSRVGVGIVEGLEGVGRDVSGAVEGDVTTTSAGSVVGPVPLLGPPGGPVQFKQPLAGPNNFRPLFLSHLSEPSNFGPVLRQTDFGRSFVHTTPLRTLLKEDFGSEYSYSDFENNSFGTDFGENMEDFDPINHMRVIEPGECVPSNYMFQPSGPVSTIDSEHASLIEFSSPEMRVARSMAAREAIRQAGGVSFNPATFLPDFEVCALDPAAYLEVTRDYYYKPYSREPAPFVEDLEASKAMALHRRAKSSSPPPPLRRSPRINKIPY